MLESYSHWICSRWEYLFDDCSDIGTIALILCVREPFTSNDSIQFLIGFRRDMWVRGYQSEKPLDYARYLRRTREIISSKCKTASNLPNELPQAWKQPQAYRGLPNQAFHLEIRESSSSSSPGLHFQSSSEFWIFGSCFHRHRWVHRAPYGLWTASRLGSTARVQESRPHWSTVLSWFLNNQGDEI